MGNNWFSWSLLVVYFVQLSTVKSSNCSDALGLENRKISNDKLSASTQTTGKESFHGRLGDGQAWCASVQDSNQYLKIDLDKESYVSGISTQGFPPNNWVTKYSISTSQDGKTWTKYSNNGKIAVFQGNSDAVTIKENKFTRKVAARYVKFHPVNFNNDICAKLEIFGCDLEEEDTQAVIIFMIVASTIAGILLITAIVFIGLNIKKRMDQQESKENARYLPEMTDDMFTGSLGLTHHSLSYYAANDATGFPKSASARNLRGLNWKLVQSLPRSGRSTLKREESQTQNSRKTEERSIPFNIDFEMSMKDAALGGTVLQKQNPMFTS